jgi:hypothetical protein
MQEEPRAREQHAIRHRRHQHEGHAQRQAERRRQPIVAQPRLRGDDGGAHQQDRHQAPRRRQRVDRRADARRVTRGEAVEVLLSAHAFLDMIPAGPARAFPRGRAVARGGERSRRRCRPVVAAFRPLGRGARPLIA